LREELFVNRGKIMPDEIKPDLSLDCIGVFCPEPLFQTREKIDQLEIGQI
jgi:TusA-related sulfurtransferase